MNITHIVICCNCIVLQVQAARDIEAVRQHHSLSAAGLNYRPPLPPALGAPGGFPGLPGLAALGNLSLILF